MKFWMKNNKSSLIVLIVMSLLLLVAQTVGAEMLALPLGGMAMAIGVRGPMDQLVTLPYTHSSETVADTVYLLGGRVMYAVNTAAADVKNIFVVRGHVEYAKTAGEAWVGGATLYWDDTAKSFTTTSTDNTKAGFAMEAADSAATTGQVFLEIATNL